MFKKFKQKSAVNRIVEEQLYDIVAKEIKNGNIREGLWAKALAKSEGDQERANSLYIEYRVQSLKDELELIEFIKKEKNEENKKIPSIETDNVFLSKLEHYITNPGSWFFNRHLDEICDLLDSYITSKEKAIHLIRDYKKLYNKDLINELKKQSSSYDKIKILLSNFIEFEIVEKNYPHNYITNKNRP